MDVDSPSSDTLYSVPVRPKGPQDAELRLELCVIDSKEDWSYDTGLVEVEAVSFDIQGIGGVLRPLTPQDLDSVCEIESSVYVDPWSINLLQESLTAPMTHTIGLFSGPKCLGYAIFQVIFSEGHLLNLAVSKEMQGKKIGRFLLQEVLKMSRAHGAESVFLEVRPSNIAGVALYEKFGFRSLLRRENYYSNGEAAIVMILDCFENAP